jgi:hypothetical protein
MRVKLAASLLLVSSMLAWATGPQHKKKPPCEPNLASCSNEGCGEKFDPKLNERKNITSDNETPTLRTLTWMKKLDDPEDFTQGGERDELTALGEGQMITVVAYLLVAKPEGAESCNCGLTGAADTDNHLVLVTKTTLDKFPLAGSAAANSKVFQARQRESETAEFTPRVRLNHPNFTRGTMQPLIKNTKQQALLVRVTGQLLFDSEHFIKGSLPRVNNWEIHPILKLEFCTTGNTCKANSDTGWKSIDDLP